METGFGGNNLCKINLAAVKTAPRKIGHGRNGQKRKLKVAAVVIKTVCSRQKPLSDSELRCKFFIENNLDDNISGKWKKVETNSAI